MELVNKKQLKGFTVGKKYSFINSEEMFHSHCYEVKDDNNEEWVMSKYKMLEFFTFESTYKENI